MEPEGVPGVPAARAPQRIPKEGMNAEERIFWDRFCGQGPQRKRPNPAEASSRSPRPMRPFPYWRFRFRWLSFHPISHGFLFPVIPGTDK